MNASANLMSPEELLRRLGDPELRVIDARFELTDPAWGAAAYAAGHVPGAVYLDLDRDLSSAPGAHGGRHPLPAMDELAAKLGALGVGPEHEVVVYDQSGTMYSARAWWLLRYAGHERVRVLDGGLAAYQAAGGELVTEAPAHPPTAFPLRLRPEMVVDVTHVREALGDPEVLLLDARAPERYRGEVEPLDKKAGHIPGALNRHFLASLKDGRFRTREELARALAPAAGKAEVIAYCGSGVSGAHLVLALEEAGYGGAKLYAGSWSDWSSYDDLPVAVGDEG
ncbi:MAG: sulfurtransferase [Deinococcales bacterium]|nr:sulfurtransferase [Deinococcales bacterium]